MKNITKLSRASVFPDYWDIVFWKTENAPRMKARNSFTVLQNSIARDGEIIQAEIQAEMWRGMLS